MNIWSPASSQKQSKHLYRIQIKVLHVLASNVNKSKIMATYLIPKTIKIRRIRVCLVFICEEIRVLSKSRLLAARFWILKTRDNNQINKTCLKFSGIKYLQNTCLYGMSSNKCSLKKKKLAFLPQAIFQQVVHIFKQFDIRICI